jgi:protein gp37
LRDQCRNYDVPFHFKQWGHWSPETQGEPTTRIIEIQDEAGRRERLSWRPKQLSGRMLDGQTWDGYPQVVL